MQSGKLGVLIVVLALMFSIFGGFILNAEDKTVCTTNFDYVTDIAGAFTGAGSDISVDYNPATNITGYSVFSPVSDEITTNTIHGINYTTTNANGFWIQENTGNTTSKALKFTNNKGPAVVGTGQGTLTIDNGSPINITIGDGWGFDTPELKTDITVDGFTVHRVVGVGLPALMAAIGTLDTNNAYISVNGPINSYPCFIANAEFKSHDVGYGPSRYVSNEVTYSDASWQIKLNPLTYSAEINGTNYGFSDITFVWGDSVNFEANATLFIGANSVTRYVDPVYGVQPIAIHGSNTVITQTTSKSTSIQGAFSVTKGTGSAVSGNASVTLEGGRNIPLFDFTIINSRSEGFISVSGGAVDATVNPPNDYGFTWQWSTSDMNWVYIWANTPMSEPYSARIYVNVESYGNDLIEGVNTSINRTGGAGTPSNTIYDLTNNVGNSGAGNVYLNTVVTTTHSETQTYNYTDTYWANGYGNTALSMLIKAPSTTLTDNYTFTYALKGGSSIDDTLTISYDNTWSVGVNDLDSMNVGKWPALMITMRLVDNVPFYFIEPVSKFVSFQDYIKLGNSYSITDPNWTIENHEAISMNYITFSDTDSTYMYHEIVNTTVLLIGGGLFVQDGTFSPAISFPEDKIIQFKVMSAAHVGDSMTVTTSEGTTLTINSNGLDGWIINGKNFNYYDVSIFYVDADIPTISIGDVIYDAGIYYNGSIYDKGHLYIQAGKTAPLIDLGSSTNSFTITLDGTWAASTAYYTGENVGTQTTEISEPGTWHWSEQEFLIVFLGVILVGTIIGAWRFRFTGYDWLAVLCSASVVYLILG